MKNSTLLLFALSYLLIGATESPVYQVISGDPHDVIALAPHVETVKVEGRLWLVRPLATMPSQLMANLRQVGANEKLTSYVHHAKMKKNRVPAIMAATRRVEVSRLQDDIEKLASYKTRLVGTDDNRAALAWTEERLKNLGYTTQQVCYSRGNCSVIADKAGTDAAAGIVLTMAHIDSVGKNMAGADDNASGTAALLEMARVLSTVESKYTLRFFVTNGEESGLLGANHYADQLADAGEISKLVLAINMDMVGYNKSNNIVELETNAPYEGLAKEFAALAATYTTLKSKITLGAWGSDHVPFLEKGVNTILTIENWSTKTPCYHAACDKPDTINYEYAGEITKLNVAAIMADETKSN